MPFDAENGLLTDMPYTDGDDKPINSGAGDVDEFGEPIPPEVDNPPVEEQAQAEPQQQSEPATPGKRVQTPEENARFAEMRRRKQAEEYLKQTPHYQIAEALAKQYGVSVEQFNQKLQEALLQRQAQQTGVPVQVLQQIEQERQARQQLEQRVVQTEFKNWMQEKMMEAQALRQQYPFLTDQDIQSALQYMLTELKNTKIPLSQAVMALHGEKIATELRKSAQQEALAQISGRKNGTLPPQGGKSTPTPVLTEEERYVARMFGMTDEEYAKYRDEYQ